MTVELALCLILAFAAYPMSRSISAHYFLFAAVNGAMLGFTTFDSSLLVLVFMSLAVADSLLFLCGGRKVLLAPTAMSAALAIESMLNMDWLLNHITYINAAVNAVIVASLIKGKRHWTRGK